MRTVCLLSALCFHSLPISRRGFHRGRLRPAGEAVAVVLQLGDVPAPQSVTIALR